jgi:hypothetical protein
MNQFRAIWGAAFVITILFFSFGCQPVPVSNSGTSNGNMSVANSAPVTTSPEMPKENSKVPVTMPLIDALLNDPTFVDEAKRNLGLTDDEVAKLRDASRGAVLELGVDPADDDARSTTVSMDLARTQTEKVLGPQKTASFFQFVQQRWSGGEPLAGRPNAVPTDSRVVVNAPAYRMDIFRDGKLVKTYKVGIGYPEFPLPTGLRRASELIFNPTWTPPDEPWVKGKVRPGETVQAGSKLNPLGPIKIPIGLPSLIHGGKSPDRLGNFASHGCVGLTDPLIRDFSLELASLSGTELSAQKIEAYGKNKTQTENVKLAQPVAVELRYETIVAGDGKVTIYRDVYERGTNTEENLRSVLEAHGIGFDSLSEVERSSLITALGQMAVDAKGEPVDTSHNSNSNSSNRNSNSSAKVTRNVKGTKEIVVPVAALRGKGYPEPAGLKQ